MAAHAGINHNRRSTFRRMAQMNEDRLTSLRNPPRAEVTRRVLGHLESHNADMKKQVNLWYKEQNFALNKLNRGQNKVYRTFLKVNYEQKKLERLAYEKKRQQELMERMAAMNSKLNDDHKYDAAETGHQRHEDQKKNTNLVQNGDSGEGHAKMVEGDSKDDSAATTVKKYNRHRSEFNVVVNAPTAIDVQVEEPKLESLKESPQEGATEGSGVRAESKPQNRAKVLVVRKQNEEAVGRNDSFDLGAALTRDKSKSFLKERSGSFYIQTMVVANEDIGTKASEKQVDEEKDKDNNKKEGNDFSKGKILPKIETDQKDEGKDKKEGDGFGKGKVLVKIDSDKKGDNPQVNTSPMPTITESGKTEITVKIKGLERKKNKKNKVQDGDQFLFKPRKYSTVGNKGPGYSLGELRTGSVYRKPAPPTSYSYSALEEEKERQRVSHEEYLGRTTHSSHSFTGREWDAETGSPHRGGATSKMTIAQYNKLMRKERERIRKEVLDGETPMLYERNVRGELILSQDDFKRREFKKPSSAEKKNRVRLLYQSRQDMKVGRSKVLDYIDRLSEQERQERMERERRLRQKEMDAAAAKAEAKKLRAAETDPGVLLRSLIRAFRKGDLEQSEDPNSVDSLQRCDYIRVYQTEDGSRGRREPKKRYKTSSWNQNANVGKVYR